MLSTTVVLRALRHLVLAAALVAGAGVVEARPKARVAQVEGRATDAARATVAASEQRRASLLARRAALAARYQRELAEIDRLKRQKASWRRDRQLRERLSASLETAKQLGAASNAITLLDGQLAKQRRALIAAIDAELAGAPAAARRAALRTWRADVVGKSAPARAKKIVLPDDELDPNADPEELDQQADALRDSEAELARQIASLDRQAARFRKQVELKKQHRRAGELASRDDDQPRRTSGSGARGGAGEAADPDSAPTSDDGVGGESPPPEPEPQDPGMFEGDPAVVLSDVVDGATIDALRKAARSTDPAAKAAAAEKAREQVRRRLDALKKRRQLIEQRAKDLRD